MDKNKIVALVGKVLTVTVGVLVAFQVQTYLAKRSTEVPQTAA